MPTSYSGAYSIPDGIEIIIECAFYSCNNLTSLEIPSSVTSIEDDAVYGCRNLNTVTLNSDAIVNRNYSTSKHITGIFGSQVRKYIIGDRVTGIGTYAFYYGANDLSSIEIGNNVISIGARAFEDCWGMDSIKIGSSIKNIGDRAFYHCSNLTSLYCRALLPPPNVNSLAFYTINSGATQGYHLYEKIDLYVPAESVELYKKADIWRKFQSISAIVE